MVILAGIDEAGYGPLLGPLVVSAAALELPEEVLRADLWALLGKAVAKEKKHLKGRLLITDSKKAYTPAAGVGHLRRTVLAALAAADPAAGHPQTAAELLGRLCPAVSERLTEYPWHRNVDDLPLGENPQAVDVAAAMLRRSLDEHGMRLAGLMPAVGIHHCNKYNAFCLADDVVEPFRGFVEAKVRAMCHQRGPEETVSQSVKAELLETLYETVNIGGYSGPLMVGLHRTAASLYRCLAGEAKQLELPEL